MRPQLQRYQHAAAHRKRGIVQARRVRYSKLRYRRRERYREEDGCEGGRKSFGKLGESPRCSRFSLRRALNVARRARANGVAGGWLRTAGFSSGINMKQQQSGDLTLVYWTSSVAVKASVNCRKYAERCNVNYKTFVQTA